MTTEQEQIERAVADLVGQRCARAENPHGSILSIDLGPLALRSSDAADARPHGWRHLTILSPWRLQTKDHVVADWNVDGGVAGVLPQLIQQLVGDRVIAAQTSMPAWDLRLDWESGLTLTVFGDCTNEREDAWFILGTDGLEIAGSPRVAG